VDADGYGDVVVGIQHEDAAGDGQLEGGARLYLGSSAGLALATWPGSPPPPLYHLGESIACGDVNGDGFDDLVLGSGGSSYQQILGRVFVYLGYPGGLAPTHTWKEAGTELAGGFGTTAAVVDINLDGWCVLAADGSTEDRNDSSDTTYPGPPEVCDGVDSACAGALPADEADTCAATASTTTATS
jgi:hypothetical protein